MKYFFALIFSLLLIFPLTGRAAFFTRGQITSDLTLSYNDKKIVVPSATVQTWTGRTLVQNPHILTPAFSAEELLEKFVGNNNTTVSDASQYYDFNPTAIYNYLNNLALQINQPTIEPVLDIQNDRVTNFAPPQDGQELDLYNSTMDILNALEDGQTNTNLQVSQTHPRQNLADLNNLGINSLISRGTSNFAGSPNNRRHNIATGVEKFKGLLIAPGQTFSFDDHLGPVTAEAGFVPELVIDKGTTLPELGGGLCQVSTTTFRAAMAAGLPITDRRNHAYAVSYYSPQGTDATIYPGSADLKFINNTPGYVLIWPYQTDKNNLNFDFYGTTDGRQVTLQKPVVYDRTTDGAMKASWTRVVIAADGTASTSTFKSIYQPPALFHKTETFVSATGTPTSKLN